MPPAKPALAPKELALFKALLRLYETKQYKKGIKTADLILKRFPDHPDTLAMKGLLYTNTDRKQEGYDLIRRGLKCDLTSHICWHVYGIVQRADKNYDEALKCYANALKFDRDNHQILRDFAMLQVQLRMFAHYAESRSKIIQLRPEQRQNWSALALAQHLSNDYSAAESTLASYQATLKRVNPWDLENSEALLYHNMVIYQSGDIERALSHLQSIELNVLDKLTVAELHAKYLLLLKNWQQAEKAYFVLMDRNSDKIEYFVALEQVRQAIDDNNVLVNKAALKTLYHDLQQRYPKSDAAKRRFLDHLNGDEFRDLLKPYLIAAFQKGIPSIFANIKSLYQDKSKREIAFQVVNEYIASLDTLDNSLLWAHYYLAQHHDYIANFDKAQEYIETTIQLSPETVELRMFKARILKHVGDIPGAAKTMNEARESDLRDRFVNTKCVKYYLRDNQNTLAAEIAKPFTRKDAPGGSVGDLSEMQAFWFILEDGQSYLRQGKLGLALKRFHTILKIFDEWADDQFDFHAYAVRKGTIRTYIDMLKWEDQLRSNPNFVKAAHSAVKIYCMLYDNPEFAHGIDNIRLNESEKKRAIKKAKKSFAAKKNDVYVLPGDDDPFGEKLAKTTEPLKVVDAFLKPLVQLCSKEIETWLSAFEVYIRSGNYIASAKALQSISSIDSSDPRLCPLIARFFTQIRKAQLADPVKELLNSQLKAFIDPDVDLDVYLNQVLDRSRSSARGLLSTAEALAVINSPNAEKILFEILQLDSTTIHDAQLGLAILEKWTSPQVSSYKVKAGQRWPMANAFHLVSNGNGIALNDCNNDHTE
ncbi:N-terminal acetyltransferase A complex subunit nat1 [Neolecta irregularis DAH-3]|uniref:N-terminal acetyltransferase A complex subunit nat1 n=1 Tax=Neolecta irregularis (strain DAH-3) TaxID=1198029 RepID=A0A1U7LVL2_NEOID|nr:N-terminal acetyltransferase A complex subunit nat1 [Neolecta irregularis DAH-3]|eukprot:OLL26716.1 N-terminal acetyltransferase A complex subunit nat1 [Neolecta irregularis DAH-3]